MHVSGRVSPHRRVPPWTGLILGLFVALSSAQAGPQNALDAANPDHPTGPALALPLHATPDTRAPAPPGDMAQARAIWQQANERVAEFPRGHIDLLRWEARQADAPAAANGAGDAPALDFTEALRLSLRHRPELFTHDDMNPLARAQVRVAYAGHVRGLRRAWIDAIATRQSEHLLGEALDAARTGSELGRRMVGAGNWSQARQMREVLIETRAWQAHAEALAAALDAQERLAQYLGMWDARAVLTLSQRLPASLPEPPDRPSPGEGLSEATLEAAVLRGDPTLEPQRLQARRDIATPVPAWRQTWNDAVDTALDAHAGTDASTTPPHIDDLRLLRDHSLQRAARAEAALLRQASERRSMARQAWTALQLRHASAQQAQHAVAALQAALAQETLLRYNGMLQSSWELLASARDRLASLDAAVQTRRGYWLAQADWQALLAGAGYAGPDTPSSSGASMAPAAGH